MTAPTKSGSIAPRCHIKLFEHDYKLRPQQAVIQSWTLRPTRALPETASESLTSLVLYYAKQSRVGAK